MSQTFPNEILGSIVDAAVQDTSTYDRPTVRFLKDAALVSPFFRRRAQEHLFRNVAIHIDSSGDRAERLLSALQDNPSLSQYPRCLTLDIEVYHIDKPANERFPSASTVVSICRMLKNLNSFSLLGNQPLRWSMITRKLQDAIVNCIKRNELKHFNVSLVDLPSDFIQLLPSVSTITLSLSDLADDSSFRRDYLREPSGPLDVAARPARLTFKTDDLTWIEIPRSSVFERVSALDYQMRMPHHFLALLPRVSSTLKHLTVRHAIVMGRCQSPFPAAFKFKVSNVPFMQTTNINTTVWLKSRTSHASATPLACNALSSTPRALKAWLRTQSTSRA
jgi:hypothetical protein